MAWRFQLKRKYQHLLKITLNPLEVTNVRSVNGQKCKLTHNSEKNQLYRDIQCFQK